MITILKNNKFKKVIIPFCGGVGGIMGAWSGGNKTCKLWRRVGIPILLTLYATLTLGDWRYLTILFMIIPFSLGYGVPKENVDSGSTLGKLLSKYIKARLWLNVAIRGTIGVLVCLSLLSFPLIKGSWVMYIITSLGIMMGYTIISWRDLGRFEFRGKMLLWSEFWLYTIIVGLAKWLI